MSRAILSDQNFGGTSRITNLPPSAASGQPVVHEQLQSALEGLKWKDPVKAYATANVNLASPGAAISGTTMSAGDRFLAPNQTAPAEAGIYVWNGAAVPATRAADANAAAELTQAIVPVAATSSANPNTTWRQTATITTLGTDAVAFGPFGTVAPAASETTPGIAEVATQAETDTGTDDLRIVTPLKLANWSGRKRKGTATIGDGSATSYTLTHNFNTRDVTVELYSNGGNYDTVECEVRRSSVNAVQLLFAVAPANNAYNVVVLG